MWNKVYLHLCHTNIGVRMSGGNKIGAETGGGKLCQESVLGTTE